MWQSHQIIDYLMALHRRWRSSLSSVLNSIESATQNALFIKWNGWAHNEKELWWFSCFHNKIFCCWLFSDEKCFSGEIRWSRQRIGHNLCSGVWLTDVRLTQCGGFSCLLALLEASQPVLTAFDGKEKFSSDYSTKAHEAVINQAFCAI